MNNEIEKLIAKYSDEIAAIKHTLGRMPHGDSRMSQRISDYERFISELNSLTLTTLTNKTNE